MYNKANIYTDQQQQQQQKNLPFFLQHSKPALSCVWISWKNEQKMDYPLEIEMPMEKIGSTNEKAFIFYPPTKLKSHV